MIYLYAECPQSFPQTRKIMHLFLTVFSFIHRIRVKNQAPDLRLELLLFTSRDRLQSSQDEIQKTTQQ